MTGTGDQMMQDESRDLMQTLAFTVSVIADSKGELKRRIANAYVEAQQFAATIPLDGNSARPRIVACLERFSACQTAGDVAAAGWMLAAIQERIAEGELAKWQELKIMADKAAALLRPPRKRLH